MLVSVWYVHAVDMRAEGPHRSINVFPLTWPADLLIDCSARIIAVVSSAITYAVDVEISTVPSKPMLRYLPCRASLKFVPAYACGTYYLPPPCLLLWINFAVTTARVATWALRPAHDGRSTLIPP